MSASPLSAQTLFITGTDTGVGKTRVACGLLRQLRAQGHSAAGFKPVASGAERTPQGLRNEDALLLQAASSPGLAYDEINPHCFEPAIAPHLAAQQAGVEVSLAALDQAHAHLVQRHQRVVVEGAGGWLVPLNARDSFADWVAGHGWPVVLVVGMRLGCINHALLSAESIRRRTRLLGWVANCLPPAQSRLQDNIDTLCRLLPEPLLAQVPEGATESTIATLLVAPEVFRDGFRFTPANSAP